MYSINVRPPYDVPPPHTHTCPQVSYSVTPLVSWLLKLLTPTRDHVLFVRPRAMACNIGTESVQTQRLFAACMDEATAAGWV